MIKEKQMCDKTIVKRINNIVENLDSKDNAIYVLKGIPLSMVDDSIDVNLEEIVNNRLSYLSKIVGQREFITYEEYLLLYHFIEEQYSEIIIINNNLFMEQYPIDLKVNDRTRMGLLNHFAEDDEVNDELVIGEISSFISLFNGLKKCDDYYLVAYCENEETSLKVQQINLFDAVDSEVEFEDNHPEDFIDLIEESDYVNLVTKVLKGEEKIVARISNYMGDIQRLKERINILNYYFSDQTEFVFIKSKSVKEDATSRSEYKELLTKYWGYDSFRNLPVYDMNKLENGEKEIVEVSQETIISNIVDEAEKCVEDKGDFRDVFVTAPTGAGKSVMFQIPAMYLAEKHNLLTIVISPLIGLMKDQVQNLELKNYHHAKTINSDISPIVKGEIIDKVAEGEYHILYISPETLLSRSDVEQLIGDRTIGMIVIDEAHIVTTWGKQFRPDYWYLGDHIRKLRKKQLKDKGRSFLISTFTATAIYHGEEDMYTETINSLHMLTPITYLGYVKRDDINILIKKNERGRGERSEYELNKFEDLEAIIDNVLITKEKMLVYFPTIALIKRCYEYLDALKKTSKVSTYYGSLEKDEKEKNYQEFYNGEKTVMLATKAFGMGIDIDDISYVVHFAPTGNVCDYVQEIGRAARRKDIIGKACYSYNTRDFQHINRLHGLSVIKRYQLVEVIKKIVELYNYNVRNRGRETLTRKRNAMLLDAENFAYIFGSPVGDGEDDNINKVKTSLLIIQKDFESKIGFSPIYVRPVPMFAIGFFKIDKGVQDKINERYPNSVEEINAEKKICRVNLDEIWKKDYQTFSFPKFKYLLYSKSDELSFNSKYKLSTALCVNVVFHDEYEYLFNSIWGVIKTFIKQKIIKGEFADITELENEIQLKCKINKYKAKSICEVLVSSMDAYRKNFASTPHPIIQEKRLRNGKTKYQFNTAANSFISWVENGYSKIINNTENGKMYLVNSEGVHIQAINTILGILESMGVLTFEMIGGANSQLYIYVNQIQSLINIINNPLHYKNRLLEMVYNRHLISVKMLTYFFEGDFNNEERWDIIEDYFLGGIPDEVKERCIEEKPDITFKDNDYQF